MSGNEKKGVDAREVSRDKLLAWTSLANWRWLNLAFLWSQAKRPIWLAIARLKRLVKQLNINWVVYGSLAGG